jgi:hypothetical protein
MEPCVGEAAKPAPVPGADEGQEEGRNATDAKLLAIWRDLFGMASIGLNDNFFDLGGDSLLLARLMSRIRAEFGECANDLTLGSVFHTPYVEGISDLISAASSIWQSDRNLHVLGAGAAEIEQGEI